MKRKTVVARLPKELHDFINQFSREYNITFADAARIIAKDIEKKKYEGKRNEGFFL